MMLRARRLVLSLAAMFTLLLGGAAARLVWLHTATHEMASARQARQSVGSRVELARRGALRDRQGSVVGDSLAQIQLYVYTNSLLYDGSKRRSTETVARSVDTIANTLSGILGLPEEELAELLFVTAAADSPISQRIGRPVSDPELIDLLLSESEGNGLLRRVDMVPSWTRRYPWGSVAGNLLGFVNAKAEGAAGLEHGLQGVLGSGVDGRRSYLGKVAGFSIATPDLKVIPALHGDDVVLTLDMVLQQMVEEELALGCEAAGTTKGSAVLIDAWTGDVLAMASAPSLDPNDQRTWTKERQVFRPLQTINAPGSTFKPLMLAAALDLGLVAPETKIDTHPRNARYGYRTVHDTHSVFSPATLEEIIVESSNIGMASIMTRLVSDGRSRDIAAMKPLHDILMRLGLTQKVGMSVSGQAAGLLTRLEDWSLESTLVSVSFGYEMSLTPLQLAAAAATLSDGYYRVPRLISGTVDQYGNVLENPIAAPRPVFTRETVDRVRGYMAVAWDDVRPGWLEAVGVPVAGKTGTIVPLANGGREAHAFIALAPSDAPRVALAIVLEEPTAHRYSRASAGPLADAILARVLPYLGVEGR
jgi:cell division protein FtsI (penicillin-binding protein 3)